MSAAYGGGALGMLAGLRHQHFQGVLTNGMAGGALTVIVVCAYDGWNKARKQNGKKYWN
jgi:uncharacterized membrane protein